MIKVVVPISTGKDSQACLKLSLEKYPPGEVIGLFCDTGWEHPSSYRHLEKISDLYGVRIDTVKNGTVESEIKKLKKFPNSIMRFCTDRLKIVPSSKYYRALMENQKAGFEVWTGVRSGESTKRALRYKDKVSNELYEPHEVNKSFPKLLAAGGVMFRLPIIDWSTQDVFDYVGMENVNPLYQHGFDRVGCFPCLASAPQKQANAFNFDLFGAGQKQKVISLEKEIGKKHEAANTDQMCMFCHI